MITIAILVSTMAIVVPITYPQEETPVFGTYDDPMSEEYGWKSYLANGGERTAYNPGPAPDTLDNQLWTMSGISVGQIAMDGKIICASGGGGFFSSGGSGTIYALDPNDGHVIWQQSGTVGSTMFGFNTLFQTGPTTFMVLSSGVQMRSSVDGSLLWTDNTINPSAVYHPALMAMYPEDGINMFYGPVSSSSSVVPSGMFPENLNNYYECGWNMSNPEENWGSGNRFVWAQVMDWGGNPQLCYGDGKVYMGEYSGWGVNALDAKTGEVVWRFANLDANGYAAVYGDGKLFLGCQSRHVTCVNTTDGTLIWRNSIGETNRAFNVWHGCYAYGRVYWHDLGEGLTGETKCFDADTGEKLWGSLTVSQIGYYQICVADGKVWGQMSDGSTTTGRDPPPTSFACWDAFTGELLWNRVGLSCTAPVVAYGNLYITTGGGYGGGTGALTCYGPSTAPDPAPVEPEPEPEPVDWAMWRGNVENPGVATEQHAPIMLNAGPVWTAETDGGISSSPAVADGKVFIGSTDGYLYCFNVTDGDELWSYNVSRKIYSSPAYANGRVYTGSDNGLFLCLDAETGDLLYTAPDGDGSYRTFASGLGQMNIRSSPIIYNSRVYVGGASGYFYCFDLDLDEQWSYNTGQYIGGSAAIADGYVYIFSMNNNMYKFDISTGTLATSRSVTTSFGGGGMFAMSSNWETTPVVVGDTVYIGQQAQYIAALNSTDLSIKWTNGPYFDTSEAAFGSPTYYEGNLYTACGPKTLGVTASDGTQLWEVWGAWEIFCSTIVVPDTLTGAAYVYIGSEAASVTCIDLATGEPMSWYTTGGPTQSTPAIYGGKLIFGSADHKVYCFEDPVFEEDTDPTMSVSLSRDTVYVDAADSVVITAQLKPGIPCMDLVATVIAPNETVYDLPAVSSDIKGCATFTYVPDAAGNWSVMASWAGTDNLRGVAYPAAYSGLINVTALVTPETLVASASADKSEMNPGDTATLTASATGGTGEYNYQWFQTVNGVGVEMSGKTSATLTVTLDEPNVYGYYCQITDSAVNPQVHSSDTVEIKVLGAGGTDMGLIYAIVGIIAVAVIAIVAYFFLKKRK